MKDRYSFVAVFEYADDGISISFPDLPGCLSCADSEEEGVRMAEDALGLYLFGMEEDGEEIPAPTRIQDIRLETNQVPVLISVYMPLARAAVKPVTVKKTLTIPNWLNIKAEQAGINFSQTLQNALKQQLNIK
ncbi:MAG: type II toxin-antitoxin system HicB family antitoxin [Oscillospiraceae bacterium]|jgi:predicted RNase H-like HicB family nuclease|nr:type II toxin-antitoxin system HicB family antitoxin [Oscillospiraceae bacterium]